jgi:hypothetical protein
MHISKKVLLIDMFPVTKNYNKILNNKAVLMSGADGGGEWCNGLRQQP